MICIKANDLPHQSIKLARASGEERKRIHQNVIVRDARSRDGEEGLPEKVGQRRKQDTTPSNLQMLIIHIIKDGLFVFDDYGPGGDGDGLRVSSLFVTGLT